MSIFHCPLFGSLKRNRKEMNGDAAEGEGEERKKVTNEWRT